MQFIRRNFIKITLVLIIFSLGVVVLRRAIVTENPRWLGKVTHKGILSLLTSTTKVEDHSISIEVIQGKNISLPKTRNTIITCKGGNLVSIENPRFNENSFYILGIITLKKKYGRRIYICDVKAKGNGLNDVIIHLRDGIVPDRIEDPYLCFFEIPRDIKVTEGRLDFQVIEFVEM